MGSSTSKPIPQQTIPVTDEKRSLDKISSDLSSMHIYPLSPQSADGSLTLSNIASWESTLSSDPKATLSRTILSHSNITSALQTRTAHVKDVFVFNNEVDFKTGPITNQKSSGRCWLFATTNVLRYDIMKKLKLKDFQLSQVRPPKRSSHSQLIIGTVILILLGQTQQIKLLS